MGFTKIDRYKFSLCEKVLIAGLHEQMSSLYKDLLFSFMEKSFILETYLNDIDPNNRDTYLNINNTYLLIKVMKYKNTNSQLDDFSLRARQFVIVA